MLTEIVFEISGFCHFMFVWLKDGLTDGCVTHFLAVIYLIFGFFFIS